jgi:hypothetical protein
MDQLFPYLLKSAGLIAVFYLAYHFLVRKETFFNSNRWFLLTGLLTSLLLPLYFIKRTIWIARPKIQVQEMVACVPTPTAAPPLQDIPPPEAFDWSQLIWMGYTLIALILIVKIAIDLLSLYRMLYQQQVIKNDKFKLVHQSKNVAPFSFFNYIVYNAELYSDEELQSILLHEQIHSREKHSADVLFAEILCAVFWFNPFIWLYKKAIKQNLEYIADQKAIGQLEDKKSYQHTLLKVVSNQNCLPITNNFYQSLIKKRIIMLNKNQSHKRSSWKYAMVIPALIGFLFLFQIKTEAKVKTDETALLNAVAPQTPPDQICDKVAAVPAKSGEKDVALLIDKISSDNELKKDAAFLKEVHDIDYVISNVKRNEKGEIIAIQVSYDDNKGNKGKIEQHRTIPIRPIFFKVSKTEAGKNIIGFYDNPEMVVQEADAVNENKITTIESIQDDALIYVDTERYTKEDLNELDPKGLASIEVLKDVESLQKYGAKDKGAVYIITTNWPSREQNIAIRQQASPSIITLQNGDEVVLLDKSNLKLPGYPTISFTENSPILIVDGVQQKNPRLTLERMNVSKIKTIKVLNENDKEVKGTTAYKMILTTK